MAKIHESKIKISASDSTRNAFESAKSRMRNTATVSQRMTAKIKKHWIALSASIAGAFIAIQKAWNLAEQAAKFQQSRMAFKSMVQGMGKDAEVEFNKIREMSAGLIDEKALIESANKAMALGIPIERIGELMEISRAKARDMGTEMKTAFSDIVTGIGRGSALILDNLGIIISVTDANKAWAEANDVVVSQMTDLQKKQAFLNAVIDKGSEAVERYGDAVLTTNEKMQRLKATIQNMQLHLGAFIIRLGVGLVGVLNAVALTAVETGKMLLSPFALLEKGLIKLGIGTSTFMQDSFNKLDKWSEGLRINVTDSFTAMIAKSEELAGVMKEPPDRFIPEPTQPEDKDAQKKAERALRLQALQTQREIEQLEAMWKLHYLSESERLDQWYIEQQEKAGDNVTKKIFVEEIFWAKKKKLDDKDLKAEQKKDKLEKKMQKQALNDLVSNLQAAGQQSRTAFEVWKLAAIAQTTIDTYKAAMGSYSALASIPYVGPALGIAAAAAAVAAGIARISAIRSTSYSGGGGAGAGAGTSASGGTVSVGGFSQTKPPLLPDITDTGALTDTTASRTVTININVEGSLVDHSGLVDELAPFIRDAIGDGVVTLNVD